MLDHVSVQCDDLAASREFYERLLAPLGVTVAMDYGDVLGELEKRDWDDSSRADSPLTLDDRYTLIDSTGRSVSAVVDQIEARVRQGI